MFILVVVNLSLDTAREMEKQGRMLDAIRCYLLGADHDTALKLSLTYPTVKLVDIILIWKIRLTR